MIDGFGIPPEGWDASVYSVFTEPDFIELIKNYSVAVDACLGIKGIPQSATGQTSMFTGINAAEFLGRHYAAFPGKSLKQIIAENNIMLKVRELGMKSVFANAYINYSLKEMFNSRFCSVTTAMTYSVQEDSFLIQDLKKGKCVYHDITNWTLSKNFSLPLITPETAAANLISLSQKNNFTLFEYFLTDHAGHKNDFDLLKKSLRNLSRFVMSLYEKLPKDTMLLICSDHGNCEDINSKTHTLNPVPLITLSRKKKIKHSAKSIINIYNLVLEFL